MGEEPDVMALLANRPEETSDRVVKTLRTDVDIMGDTGTTERLLPITDRQMIESVTRNRFTTAYFEVLAIVVTTPEITGKGVNAEIIKPYGLLAIDIRPLKTALQIAAPTPGELQLVDQQYRLTNNPLAYIMAAVERNLGIRGLDRLPIQREAIEMQVLAAVTEGQRASTLVIGPPGVGKNLIGKAAALLQPIAREALPTKVTEAGLIGVGSGSSKRDNRNAGILPQAHQGVFIVQDWNQANAVKNQRLSASLATAMQDGKVFDSSATRCAYDTRISVVLDANRQSDVRRLTNSSECDGLDLFVHDTNIPTNLLTRFTYVAEITRSVEDQIHTLGLILESAAENRDAVQAEMADEMRHIRVWLARLRDVHRDVTIPNDVASQLSMRIKEAINVSGSRLAQRGEYADFMVRLADQAQMLVRAHSRLHNRSESTIADVEGVYPYLHRKMSFVRSLLYGADTASHDVNASAPGRRTLIRLRLKPGLYTPKQVQRQLCLSACSVDAVEDDLRALYGQPDEEGVYHVPA